MIVRYKRDEKKTKYNVNFNFKYLFASGNRHARTYPIFDNDDNVTLNYVTNR